jgi:hypothetical protein
MYGGFVCKSWKAIYGVRRSCCSDEVFVDVIGQKNEVVPALGNLKKGADCGSSKASTTALVPHMRTESHWRTERRR